MFRSYIPYEFHHYDGLAYTSAADTDQVIDDALARFERVLSKADFGGRS